MSLPTDNSKITTIILSGNKDYIPWSRSIQIGLNGRGKLEFIDGTLKKNKSNKTSRAKWGRDKENCRMTDNISHGDVNAHQHHGASNRMPMHASELIQSCMGQDKKTIRQTIKFCSHF
jgi:gag-polypeptide of LTR copia-type